MTLEEYFNLILDKYSKNEYIIKNFTSIEPKISSFHLEAQHYMMSEWYEDHWIDKYDDIFSYILVPNDCDYDFYNTKFEDFLIFLASIKIKDTNDKIKNKIKKNESNFM